MGDPYYKDLKMWKEKQLRRQLVADSEGIPPMCPCGSRITIEMEKNEIDLKKRFFVCDDYEVIVFIFFILI